ncbi:SMC family ATPase [Borrelia sp. HM]|uniref:AAA family ATPase n=1 Tax=Borrelia sp. HM TaxID=1882662 RepID=UPI001C78DF28|nr:SMC family ATPase [Borrelia sp. HM]BCR22238.1 SMC family ATPase [Borrelia sp. HM]
MRINKLVFQNIASYKGKYEIDFDIPVLKKSSIFLISGNTGAGKSTILDCITLALYARVYRLDRSISDSISKGFESAYVRLTFTVSEKIYESFIELTIKQKETPQNMILNCLSDGSLIDNKDDILFFIKNLCRLDFEQFCQTVILPQGNFQEFLTSKPRNKTAIIDNIFSLKKYDDIEIFLKRELEITKFNKEKLQFLDIEEKNRFNLNVQKLNELTNFLNSIDIKILKKNLDNVYELIFCCEQIIKFNRNYLDIQYRINNLNLELSSKVKDKEKLKHEYSLQEKIKLELDESLKFYNSNDFLDLKNFVKRHSELLHDKNKFLLELLSIQKDLEELKYLDLDNFNFSYVKDLYYENILFFDIDFDEQACDRLFIKESQLEAQKKELLEKQRIKNIELKNITSEETKFDFEKYVYYEALKLLRGFNEELILKYRNGLKSLLESIDSDSLWDININNIKVDLYKEFLAHLSTNNQSVKRDIKKLAYLEDAYKVYQGKKILKMNSLNELLELNSGLQVLQSELEVIKQDVLRTKENKIKWENQTLNFKKNNTEILKRIGHDLFNKYIDYSNKNKILIFEDKLKKVAALKAIFNDLNSKISLKEIEIEKDLNNIKSLLSHINLNINLSNPALLEEEFSELLRSKAEIENNHFKLSLHLDNINITKLKLESQIEFIEQTMLNLKKDLKRELMNFSSSFADFKRLIIVYGFCVQDFILSLDSLRPNKDSLDYFLELKSNFMSQIEVFSKDISQYETTLLNFQTLQIEINKQKINLENIKDELSSINERNDKLEILKRVVITSPTLKYYVQSFLINEILNISNKKYLSVIFPDFKLEINTNSRDFNFLVRSKRDGNMTRSVKTLSGGEKFLISLSLSLALSDMIRDSELKIEAFFLDEGFGSLDEDTLKVVIPKIFDLQRIDGRQIGIISHVSYLKEEIKAQILISKISSVSKITIESF